MEPTDITIEVLEGIREEIHTGLADVRAELKQGLAEVRQDLSAVRTDLQHCFAEVHRRHTEMEMRLTTELAGITSAVLEMRDLVQVQDHERRIAALEKKLG